MSEFHQFLILFSVIFTFMSLLLSSIGVYYGVRAWIASEALRQSTHTITMTPLQKEIDDANQEWATKQTTVDEHREMFREDVEAEMPEFANSDDDKQIYSF